MAAPELAELAPGAQGMAMVGTFLAEQVSNATYELVSVPFFAFQRRTAVQQAAAGRSTMPQTPASARGARRVGQDGTKCTKLPALISIDPLLEEEKVPGGEEAIPRIPSLERRREEREERRATKAERVRKSAARLCRGERCIYQKPGERGATPTDEDIMRSLTQPLFPTSPSMASSASAGMSTWGAPSSARSTSRRHSNYTDLFRAGFAGTELAGLPLKLRNPLVQPHDRRGVRVGGNNAMLDSTTVQVMPEDPVDAYFKMEQAAWPIHPLPLPQEDGTDFASQGSTGSPRQAPTKKGEDLWSGIVEAVLPKQRMSPLRREVCQNLRFLFFGAVGNENKKGKEKERTFYDPVGTKEQVRTLCSAWDKLDTEGTNAVELHEFRQLAERFMNDGKHDRRPSTQEKPKRDDSTQLASLSSGSAEDNAKFVAKLSEKIGQALPGKKTTVSLEDMMRLVWPCSGTPEMKQMKVWCEEFASSHGRWRVPTPKVCPSCTREELKAVFRFFDKDSKGTVSSDSLVKSGLMDRETARKWLLDSGGNDELDMDQFFELMCPTGYRANSRAETGTTKDGEKVVFDGRLQCWRLEDAGSQPGLHANSKSTVAPAKAS